MGFFLDASFSFICLPVTTAVFLGPLCLNCSVCGTLSLFLSPELFFSPYSHAAAPSPTIASNPNQPAVGQRYSSKAGDGVFLFCIARQKSSSSPPLEPQGDLACSSRIFLRVFGAWGSHFVFLCGVRVAAWVCNGLVFSNSPRYNGCEQLILFLFKLHVFSHKFLYKLRVIFCMRVEAARCGRCFFFSEWVQLEGLLVVEMVSRHILVNCR